MHNHETDNVLSAFVAPLRKALPGRVFLPGDTGFAAEVASFNLNNPLQPGAVVAAQSAGDVQEAIRFANRLSVPIAVRATAHQVVNPGVGGLLINVSRLTEVKINAAERIATVGGGVRWQQVLDEAARHGLAPLAGSSPTVGVVGYTLGGGISPVLGKSHGYASDRVRWIEVVTSNGEIRKVDGGTEPELFAALRGGKGNFGVVTAMAFDLFPYARVHGGAVYFAGKDMATVLHAWREWAPGLSEKTTTSVMVLHTPPLPELPEPIRGKFLVSVRFAHLGSAQEGQDLLSPMRAAAPIVLDTVSELPFNEIGVIHSDPVEPLPYFDTSVSLSEITPDFIEDLVSLVGPDSGSGVFVELRALGGAWDKNPEHNDAVPMRGVPYLLFALAVGGSEQRPELLSQLKAVADAAKPWSLGVRSPNLLAPEDIVDLPVVYGEVLYQRLTEAKKKYDPKNLFRFTPNIPPAR